MEWVEILVWSLLGIGFVKLKVFVFQKLLLSKCESVVDILVTTPGVFSKLLTNSEQVFPIHFFLFLHVNKVNMLALLSSKYTFLRIAFSLVLNPRVL